MISKLNSPSLVSHYFLLLLLNIMKIGIKVEKGTKMSWSKFRQSWERVYAKPTCSSAKCGQWYCNSTQMRVLPSLLEMQFDWLSSYLPLLSQNCYLSRNLLWKLKLICSYWMNVYLLYFLFRKLWDFSVDIVNWRRTKMVHFWPFVSKAKMWMRGGRCFQFSEIW